MSATMDESGSSPVERSTMLALFPTRVLAVQLERGTHEPIDRDILGFLERVREERPELAGVGKWQTDPGLHLQPELAGLVALIRSAVTELCDSLTLIHDGFEISACWANVTSSGYAHQRHMHPNNYLSGVYYVKTCEGADCIDFHDPRRQVGLIAPPARKQTLANPDTYSLHVKEGMLLIFPSWLEHSVPAHRGRELRITIAFNVMFPSFGTRMTRPLWKGDVDTSRPA